MIRTNVVIAAVLLVFLGLALPVSFSLAQAAEPTLPPAPTEKAAAPGDPDETSPSDRLVRPVDKPAPSVKPLQKPVQKSVQKPVQKPVQKSVKKSRKRGCRAAKCRPAKTRKRCRKC